MPKKGPAYPISPEWRRQVRRAVNEIIADEKREEITSDAAFAKSAGIVKSSFSEALKATSVQSTVMPQINAALGWPRPRVLSTPDELEVWAAVNAMDEREVGRLLGVAEATLARLRKRRD